MTMESDRLLFRPYTEEYFEFLFSLLSDPLMVRFIGNGRTRNKVAARQFMNWIYGTYRKGQDLGVMLLIRKEDGVPVGQAGLVPQIVAGRSEVEIGYWIAPDYWGQGYATEAAAALRRHGGEQLARQRFIALIQPDNLASRQVAGKIGMSLEQEIKLSGQKVYIYSTFPEKKVN